ncbi:MAG: uroporphyrinogen decarboxylase family protein [Candidatus Hodarchaeota archaeon]
MYTQKSDFLKALSKEITSQVPLYCTGYPELAFMENYTSQYKLKPTSKDLELYQNNYNIIEQMGFDAISLWDFRRGDGGYTLDEHRRVDGWGRIYKGEWYLWDGLFKNEKILEEWEHLTLPSQEKLTTLKTFLLRARNNLDYVISLPGLFEKTWQSMGFHHFAKCLRKNIEFVRTVVSYFSEFIKDLINILQSTGVHIFLVADDYGYKNRTFIPINVWEDLFFEEYREIIKLIHNKNQKIIIHSDGYISDMIETFIDLNFDAVQGLEPNAGVDIFPLFKRFKSNICIIGNLDMSLLTFGSPEEVNNYTIKLITKARKYNCSLVVSPSQQINSKCKPENVNAMIETTKIFK